MTRDYRVSTDTFDDLVNVLDRLPLASSLHAAPLDHQFDRYTLGPIAQSAFVGTPDDDRMRGTKKADTFDLGQGGNDVAIGGGGYDSFYMGGALSTGDRIVGGDGGGALFLDGDYSAGIILAENTLTGMMAITFAGGHSYNLTLGADTFPSNGTIDGKALGAGDSLSVDASRCDTGSDIWFYAGADTNTFIGGPGDDNFFGGGAGADMLRGGGGDGNDTFFFSAGTLSALDYVDGGWGGNDGLRITDWGSGTLSAHLEGLEYVSFAGGDTRVTFGDALVAATRSLVVLADLGGAAKFSFDGSGETDGSFYIRGGWGNDVLKGGAQNDRYDGFYGADRIVDIHGGDVFGYSVAEYSTGSVFDTIRGVDFSSSDRFDAANVTSTDTMMTVGALSMDTFDDDLAVAFDSTHLTPHQARLFTPDTGSLAGKVFLVVDYNSVAGYQGGEDLVIQLERPRHLDLLDLTDFF